MTSVRAFERSRFLASLVLGLGFGSARACRLMVLEASGQSITVEFAEGIRSITEIGRVGTSFSTYGISSRSTFVNVSRDTSMPTIDWMPASFTERGGRELHCRECADGCEDESCSHHDRASRTYPELARPEQLSRHKRLRSNEAA